MTIFTFNQTYLHPLSPWLIAVKKSPCNNSSRLCVSYSTMAKKQVSVLVSLGQKKKPTNRIGRRRKLKSVMKKIFNYLKSDSYMFAPLIHPQSSPPVSSGEFSFKPMKKKEKKLVEEVNDYLKCDAYMYAPLGYGFCI